MTDPTRFEGVRAEAQRLRDENVYASHRHAMAAFPLERAFAMQGTDTFLVNLAGEPDSRRRSCGRRSRCARPSWTASCASAATSSTWSRSATTSAPRWAC